MKLSGVTIGKIQKAWPFKKAEIISEEELNHHVHIVGASGYGKSVLLSHLIGNRIQDGKGILCIDLKGDIEMIESVNHRIKTASRTSSLKIFNLSDIAGSTKYNLIGNGNYTQIRDRIMKAFDWTEDYYKNMSGSFLIRLLKALCYLRDYFDREFDLAEILKVLENRDHLIKLRNEFDKIPLDIEKSFESSYEFLKCPEKVKSLQGLKSQLENIVLSEFGQLISCGDSSINLFKAIMNKELVFVFLDTRRYGSTATSVGRFILQDLKSVSARIDSDVLKINRQNFTVIIDEFADLAQEDFIAFLDRARSSRMSVVVAHQEICDLQRISPEFAGRLMGNTSTLYAFLQKRPESAEMISGMAGTRTVWKKTLQSEKFLWVDIPSGKSSLREVEEFNIHPNIIKTLRVGKCVCIKKYPTSRSYIVNVNPQVKPLDNVPLMGHNEGVKS